MTELIVICRFLERHRKRLEEIANRKVKKGKFNNELDISMRLNENKRQIHEIIQNCKYNAYAKCS